MHFWLVCSHLLLLYIQSLQRCVFKQPFHTATHLQRNMTLLEDFQQATIIACCENLLPGIIFSQYGKRIIRISDQHVVKWGPDVTKEEAEAQRIAYELVDSRIVRIPRAYAFFSNV